MTLQSPTPTHVSRILRFRWIVTSLPPGRGVTSTLSPPEHRTHPQGDVRPETREPTTTTQCAVPYTSVVSKRTPRSSKPSGPSGLTEEDAPTPSGGSPNIRFVYRHPGTRTEPGRPSNRKGKASYLHGPKVSGPLPLSRSTDGSIIDPTCNPLVRH